MTEREEFGILSRRHFLPSTLMKNAFALALISCAVAWGAVTGPITASASSPHSAPSDTVVRAPVLFAKKGTAPGRTTAPFTVTKVRHHAHRQYTRVVLDLTGRVVLKETKNVRKATISLTHVRLSKRAQQQIKGKKFPASHFHSPRRCGNRSYHSGSTSPSNVPDPDPR